MCSNCSGDYEDDERNESELGLPTMSPLELTELEQLAGRRFLNDRQAYEYRKRQLTMYLAESTRAEVDSVRSTVSTVALHKALWSVDELEALEAFRAKSERDMNQAAKRGMVVLLLGSVLVCWAVWLVLTHV